MFGFGNSEKSKIENEYRENTRNLPYDLPSDLKNNIIRTAEELKSKQIRILNEKDRFTEQKVRKVKEIKRNFEMEETRLKRTFEQDLKRLKDKYDSQIRDEEKHCEQNHIHIENSHSYELKDLRKEINNAKKQIEDWKRNKK